MIEAPGFRVYPGARDLGHPETEITLVSDFQDGGKGKTEVVQHAHRYSDFDRFVKNKDDLLFGAAIAIYLIVRLIGLEDYPIYFFTDEAVQTILAADLVRDRMVGYDKAFLPTFFLNVYQYNLGVSVYAQVLPYLMFGKSILVTRGTAVVLNGLAALSVGLAGLKLGRGRMGWAAILLLSQMPAWFLHSRTAFETGLGATFYAAFLTCYQFYRGGKPTFFLAAVVFSWLAFYTYTPLRMVVGLTWIGLAASDLRFHWRQKNTVLAGLGMGIILVLPWLRFEIQHPEEDIKHLRILGSYWIQPLGWQEKLQFFFREYGQGLTPGYWFFSNNVDLARHKMGNLTHIMPSILALALIGLVICLKNFHNSAYRMIMLSLAASPVGAALVAVGITRVLVMVIPITLLAAIGLERVVKWLVGWIGRSPSHPSTLKIELYVSLFLFTGLAAGNFSLLRNALVNGPFWSQDYGINGMQYGARQVFSAAMEFEQQHPGVELMISSAWANGADILARFFLPEDNRIELGSITGFMQEKRSIHENLVFVMIPEEFQKVGLSNKFKNVQVEQVIPYPNQKPGFYFVRLQYVEEIDAILAQERAERVALREKPVIIHNQQAVVRHTGLDMGKIEQIFDGDGETLIRTAAANPLVIRIQFGQPLPIQRLGLRIGGTATRFLVRMQAPDGEGDKAWTLEVGETANPRQVEIVFDRNYDTNWLHLEITNLNDGEWGHVHLWEMSYQ